MGITGREAVQLPAGSEALASTILLSEQATIDSAGAFRLRRLSLLVIPIGRTPSVLPRRFRPGWFGKAHWA